MNSERLRIHLASAGALALLLWLAPDAAVARDRMVNANEPIVISNDITNRTTEVRSAEDSMSEDDEAEAPDAGDLVPDEPADVDPPAAADDDDGVGGNGNNGHGNNDDGVDSSNPGGGHDNNGHGNNDDGVDSSNPGQGGGGPHGEVDASCDGSGECIDDESSGGGSATPVSDSGSSGGPGNGNGNGNSGGKKK
jgi:hypothetical protein